MNRNERAAQVKEGIANVVLRSLDEMKISKTELAMRMDKGASHISNFISGKANLTIDTIAELECTLGVEIFNNKILKSLMPHTETMMHEPCQFHVSISRDLDVKPKAEKMKFGMYGGKMFSREVHLLPGEKLEFDISE
ncbi:MAG: helix-turn-helix domain-containing protein [Bacteroidales bacterium]|nr:helix-turn-helix domain-containing protein [Bacteroidales bacterium]